MLDAPSPLQHYWSLAVEEQLYLVLPLVVAACLAATRRPRALLAGVLVAVIAASTAAGELLHRPGAAPLRAYYGTDSRVAEPLVGALLALTLVGPGGLRALTGRLRQGVTVAGVAGAAGLAVLMGALHPTDGRLYGGGFLLAALCAAAVTAAVTQRGTVVAKVLAAGPLRLLGRISYGVYLFHWPLFLWLTPERTGLGPVPLFGLRCVVTLALALFCYHLIELPIRLGRLRPRVAFVGWSNATVGALAMLVLATTFVPPGGQVFVGQQASAAPLPPPASSAAALAPSASPTTAAPAAPRGDSNVRARGAAPPPQAAQPEPTAPRATIPASTVPSPTANSPRPLRVAVIGDSLAANLGKGLARWGDERAKALVYNIAIPGCPLSRGGMRRWPARGPQAVPEACGWWSDAVNQRTRNLAAFDPDVVVVEDGVNELPDRYRDEWKRWYQPGDPAFTEWLVGEYRSLIDQVVPARSTVVVVNAACADWLKFGNGWETQVDADIRVLTLNKTIYDRRQLGGRAVVADLFNELCPNGRYSNEVEGVEGGRPDGLHLSDEAAYRLAARWLGPLLVSHAPRP